MKKEHLQHDKNAKLPSSIVGEVDNAKSQEASQNVQ
jgi:hypothetical protein